MALFSYIGNMKPIDPRTLGISGTVHQTIFNTCRHVPQKIAFARNDGSGASLKYDEIEKLASRIAGGLKNIGLRKGDRAGIISHNCPEWGISYLAALAAGGTVVPFDSSWKEGEIARAVEVSGVKFIICSHKWNAAIERIIELKNPDIKIITIDSPSVLNFKSLAESEPFVSSEVLPEDPAVIIYTSGTSGDPKGVILTHRNITSDLEGIVQALEFYPDDTFLSILPLHHTFESTCGFLTPLLFGLKIVYSRSLKSRDLLEDIRNQNITCMIGVPLLFEKIYNSISRQIDDLPLHKKISFWVLYRLSQLGWFMGIKAGGFLFKSMRKAAGMGSLRMMVSGAAPLPAQIAKWFNLIGFDFLEGYGLSECAPVVAVNRVHDIKFGSVGPPLPNIKMEIDNPSPEGIGEIKVKGPNNTSGYLNNPQASAELLKHGWLCTGDMGKIEKGCLYITGRKKNVIVSAAGKNIYPEEIEAALHLSPFILESVVLGKKKENKMGEEVHAIIVPDMEQMKRHFDCDIVSPEPEMIRRVIEQEVNTINSSLADYKRLIRFEIRFNEFEKTTSRKIRRTLYR